MSAGLLAVGAAGGLLVLFVLVDIFITLFGYDGFTFFAGRYHRALWAVLRAVTRPLPERTRHAMLSLGSAALLPATLVLGSGWRPRGSR